MKDEQEKDLEAVNGDWKNAKCVVQRRRLPIDHQQGRFSKDLPAK